MGRMRIRVMTEDDLERVLAIEEASFPSPWSREVFRHEILNNRFALNYVLERDGSIVGYACVWIIGDELKINNIAIDHSQRRQGLGGRLLLALLRRARASGCRKARLEVRPSNLAARSLYRRLGFVEVGRRENYYRLENEDAIVLAAVFDRAVAADGSREV